MSLNQIFMWEVSIIIPTNVKYRIINIYNKLFFKVQWNLTSHWNLRFQFSYCIIIARSGMGCYVEGGSYEGR